MKTNSAIVWFRQDLRIEDNPALNAAIERKVPVIPLYIWSPDEQGIWAPGGASRWWLHHSLESLTADLNKLGLPLIIMKGDSLASIKKLIAETGSDSVFWNRCYEPYALERDSRIKAALHEQGIGVQSFNGSLLFEPWTILNKQKKPFQVFTPFWRTCLAQGGVGESAPTPAKAKAFEGRIQSESLESLELLPKIHWDSGIRAAWTPGTAAAKSLLNIFIKKHILEYHLKRDRPDLPGVSRLSPYLHYGEISPRMIWSAIAKAFPKNDERLDCYLRQLGWREFAYHLMFHFPRTPEIPLRKDFLAFQWKDDPSALKAWHRGQTGYPIVDAGMRQLWTTGWMHNRVRMIVGSFLVKDLMISWMDGARWFWDTLVDADLANNTFGWQWVGGCGADAAPYFRIFNPVTQGSKFDPAGDYVRKWVPEIAGLPSEWIHSPWEAPSQVLKKAGVVLGKTYPLPIVDHKEARARALAAFKHLKTDI